MIQSKFAKDMIEVHAVTNNEVCFAGLQQSRDSDNLERRLERMRKDLNVDVFSKETQLATLSRYRSDVAAEFKLNYFSKQVEGQSDNLRFIENDAAFRSWISSSSSQLFVLAGENYVNSASHCWVSPVALDRISTLMTAAATGSSDELCVFHIMGLEQKENSDDYLRVLSLLAVRLATLNGEALNDEAQFSEIMADLEKYQRLTDSSNPRRGREIQHVLESLMLRVLNGFSATKTRTAWIILDRVDLCRDTSSEAKSPGRRGRRALLEAMVHLVERAKIRVKVLAVVNRADWHVEEQADELGQEKEGSLVVRTFTQGAADD
jgi:hypothetical protein